MSSDPNDRCAAAVYLMAAIVFLGVTIVAVNGWLEGMAGGEIVRLIVLTLVVIFVIVIVSALVWVLCPDDD